MNDENQGFNEAFAEFSGDVQQANLGAEDGKYPSEAPEPKAVEIDWKKEAETWRQQAETAQHRADSDAGRVSALTRKNAELQSLIDGVSRTGGDEGPSVAETKQAMADPDKWREYKEIYPDDAAAVEELIEAKARETREGIFGEISPYLKAIQAASAQTAQDQFNSAVADDHHADAFDVWGSDGFRDWMTGQPEPIKHMTTSLNPADIHYLLDTYKTVAGLNGAKANDITRQRQERLKSAESVKGGRVPKAGLPPDDFKAAFDYYAEN
jgi:hypothetical protein